MKYVTLVMSAALVAAGTAPFALAQDAAAPPEVSQQTPATATVPASPAQLKREHDRAVRAGDTANDPFDSSSSDALNQQQLQAAEGASPVIMPDEPGNADATPDATQDQNTAPGTLPPEAAQPGTPDTVPPMPPSPDTDDSPKPSNN